MRALVTGAAGFIGWKVTEFLLADDHTPSAALRTSVVGVDNLNDAYDVRLKQWRLEQIKDHPRFEFRKLDITDREALRALFNLELKAIKALTDGDEAQLLNYLKGTGYRVGLLLNFGAASLEHRRRIL